MGLLPGGGYAQYVAINKDHIMKIPKIEGMEQPEFEGAAIPEVWLTAF